MNNNETKAALTVKQVAIGSAIVLFILAAIAGIVFAISRYSNGNSSAATDAASGSAASPTPGIEDAEDGEEAEDEKITAEESEKIEEFEQKHSFGRIEDQAIVEYLEKWGIDYEFNDKDEVIVRADRTLGTLLYSRDEERTNSSKEIGLSKHPISDAPEYVFDGFTKKDVKKILAAEKKGYGTKIDFSEKKIKNLVAQDVKTMITNVVLGIGHTEQISGMYYGHSKTVYELSSAVKYIIDETEKAFEKDKDGYIMGMNRWIEKNGNYWYVTADYLANIIPVVNQIVDGDEISVEAIYAEYNWGLERADSAQLRRLIISTEPDTKAALVYRHYFKDGELMEMPATNLRDRRPEIPSTPEIKAQKSSKKTSKSDPSPGYVPHPDKNPRPKKNDPNPSPNPTPTATPKPTPTPTPTPTVKPKDPNERPTAKPGDDKGPGEPEETPRVPKSSSDDVEQSQHQPSAAPQTGGTSQPEGSLSGQSGAQTTTGGQTATDTNDGNGHRTENDQAETPEIPQRGSATGGKEGGSSTNGSFQMSD